MKGCNHCYLPQKENTTQCYLVPRQELWPIRRASLHPKAPQECSCALEVLPRSASQYQPLQVLQQKKDERDKSWNGEILYNDTRGITYIDAWQMLLLILAAMPLSHVLSILESTLWQGNDTENNAKSSKQRTTSWHTQRKTGTLSGVYWWTT